MQSRISEDDGHQKARDSYVPSYQPSTPQSITLRLCSCCKGPKRGALIIPERQETMHDVAIVHGHPVMHDVPINVVEHQDIVLHDVTTVNGHLVVFQAVYGGDTLGTFLHEEDAQELVNAIEIGHGFVAKIVIDAPDYDEYDKLA